MPMRFAESEMSIEAGILIATRAHRGQVDLGGNPYILHPLRVMAGFTYLPFNPIPYRPVEFMLAAVLHDVVEDSDWTLEMLHEAKCPFPTLEAIDCLTRRKDLAETYGAYMDRVKTNPIARAVKLLDLQDNMRVTRLKPSQLKKVASLLERDSRALMGLLSFDMAMVMA